MNATWIVSANASRARFFSQQQNSEDLEEISDMINDAARLRMQELGETDRMGPTSATKSMHNTGGAVPNKSYQPNQTPEEHQTELFARDIVDFLRQSHQQGKFEHLTLVVSPQFLGQLRKLLSQELQSIIELEINKDYTQFSGQKLMSQIRSQMTKK